MIVLTGVIIAITIIGLVVILNGLLFAENIETQQQSQTPDRFIDTTATIDQALIDLLRTENNALHTTETAISNMEENIRVLNTELANRQFEEHASLIELTDTEIQGAWIITQQEESKFRPADSLVPSSVISWDVVTANGIRNGSMTVTEATEIDRSKPNNSDRLFQITIIDQTGNKWDLWIYEEQSGTDIAFSTKLNGVGDPITECTASPPVTIDFQSMLPDDNSCKIVFANGITTPPYNLRYSNGNNATGMYRFTAGKGSDSELGDQLVTQTVLDPTDGDAPSDTDPVAYDGVYGVATTTHIDSIEFTGLTDHYQAPNEPNTLQSSWSGLNNVLPTPDEGCDWVADETDNGTDEIKIDDLVVECTVQTDESIEVLDTGVIIGDVISNNKGFDGDDATVYGSLDTEKPVNIQDTVVTGTTRSRGADIKIGSSTVGNDVTAERVIDVIDDSAVYGNLESTTKSVSVQNSEVTASVTAATTVKLDGATITGDVYIDASDFDCTDSTINGESCSEYTPQEPSKWPGNS